MSAGTARAFAARQRGRNRVFIGVAVAAMLLDAAIVGVIAAGLTRSVKGLAAAVVVVAVMTLISAVAAARPVTRIRFQSREAAESDGRQAAAARLAKRLGMAAPTVRIIDDDAVNALSAGSGGAAGLFYTSGFLREFSRPGDAPLVEAVTAHLLARCAAGDNAVSVASAGLLNWALFLFDHALLPLAKLLKTFGRGYLDSRNHHRLGPAGHVYGDDAFNRLLVWAISVAIGLCLLLVATTVILAGGVLAGVAAAARAGLTRQRVRVADAVAAELTGDPAALAGALERLSGAPTDLACKAQSVRDLCFVRDSRFYPDPDARIARVLGPAETTPPGLLAPLAGALAAVALIGGLALLAARIPYGQPFGGTPGLAAAALSAHSNPGPGASSPAAAPPPSSAAAPSPAASTPATAAPQPVHTVSQSPTAQPSPSPRSRPTPSPSASPTPSPSPSVRQVRVTVPAGGWADTGIRLRKGDLVTVRASGSWTADGSHYTGPDGYSAQSPDNFFNLADLGACADCATTPAPHWGALIGYPGATPPPVGSYTSATVEPKAKRIILIGSRYSVTSARPGELWLGFNDDAYSAYTIDNSGQVTATVTITSGT